MENELSDQTNLNHNNKENIDEIQKDENFNDKSKICKLKTISKDSSIKAIFFSFIVLIFIIYLIRILAFNKKKISIINYSSSNKEMLNKTEIILSKLKPNPSYKGPIFPDDGKISKEWVFDLIDYMKDLDGKKTNKEKI